MGFQLNHWSGSHAIYKHPDGRIVPIPVHGNDEIGTGLLSQIIKRELRITRSEFEKRLRD
jgi:predicted RNA binding protein YcfA (HicA-like mRNA interferase family)